MGGLSPRDRFDLGECAPVLHAEDRLAAGDYAPHPEGDDAFYADVLLVTGSEKQADDSLYDRISAAVQRATRRGG